MGQRRAFQTGLCAVAALAYVGALAQPDTFEPDSACDPSNNQQKISRPNCTPTACNAGIVNLEVDSHTIAPAGDVDHRWFAPNGTQMIRLSTVGKNTISTATCGPTAGIHPDTRLELHYSTQRDYYGICDPPGASDPPTGLCDPLAVNPCTNSCVDIFTVIPQEFGTDGAGGDFNPLAYDEGALSVLQLCLPWVDETFLGTFPDNEYCTRVQATVSSATFDYDIQVRPLCACPMEIEPNDSFLAPMQINLGDTIHGIYDFASRWPLPDSDLFAFNPAGPICNMTFETTGYNPTEVDTALVLYIGPDAAGNFYFTGFLDDDSGSGLLSTLALPPLPPAPDIFGGTAPNAQYILDVTSSGLHPNFPYTLMTSVYCF